MISFSFLSKENTILNYGKCRIVREKMFQAEHDETVSPAPFGQKKAELKKGARNQETRKK